MTAFIDRIVGEFPSGIARLWIAADPDGVLLDEGVVARLRERGFDLVECEDTIAFRLVYEDEYRRRWDNGDEGGSQALVLHLRSAEVVRLPADYLAHGRVVTLSLAALFPKMSYGIVRQLDPAMLGALFDAQPHATQVLGDAGTKDFVLLHLFRLVPHLIDRPEELWRELFRLHYRGGAELPPVLATHAAGVLRSKPAFRRIPVDELLVSRAAMLRTVQAAWLAYLHQHGISGTRTGEADGFLSPRVEIPFDHPDVRVYVDTMFLDGALHPIEVQGSISSLPEWARVGVVQDPFAMRQLVAKAITALRSQIPGPDGGHRDWTDWAWRFGELLSRFHSLDAARATSLESEVATLRRDADEALSNWARIHYANLASLPAVKSPVMVHRTADLLAMRRTAGEDRIALLVFDGLAIDQWVTLREALERDAPGFTFAEGASFAWVPTLTSVSRQAIFSGMRPREFAETIEGTAAEPQLWARYWQNQGLRSNEVVYRKSLRRLDQLGELETLLEPGVVKVAGLVVDMVDEIIHGAQLGKRGVAGQIMQWGETGFASSLFGKLLDLGYHVYLTADHGNTIAVGVGSPGEGLKADLRGERVRVYRTDDQRAAIAVAWPGSVLMDVPGLPTGFVPLYAAHGAAFIPYGTPSVVHGGLSVEEVFVPFVKVDRQP